jgi:hypothetical protein
LLLKEEIDHDIQFSGYWGFFPEKSRTKSFTSIFKDHCESMELYSNFPILSISWSVVGLSFFLSLINHDKCYARNSILRKHTESGSDQGAMLKNKALPRTQRPTSPVL